MQFKQNDGESNTPMLSLLESLAYKKSILKHLFIQAPVTTLLVIPTELG